MNTSHFRRFTLVVMVAGVLALAGAQVSTAKQASADDDPGSRVHLSNLALAHKLFDAVFNDGDPVAASQLVAEDAAIQTAYGKYTGPAGLLDYVAAVKRTYPDASFEITTIVVSGDTVDIAWKMTATRFAFSPYEQAVDVISETPGAATITVHDARVSGLSLDNGEVVFTEPHVEVAATDSRPCPPVCNF